MHLQLRQHSTQQGQVERLSHHVFIKGKGWIRQVAKPNPMVLVTAKVDRPAYTALQVKVLFLQQGYQKGINWQTLGRQYA